MHLELFTRYIDSGYKKSQVMSRQLVLKKRFGLKFFQLEQDIMEQWSGCHGKGLGLVPGLV